EVRAPSPTSCGCTEFGGILSIAFGILLPSTYENPPVPAFALDDLRALLPVREQLQLRPARFAPQKNRAHRRPHHRASQGRTRIRKKRHSTQASPGHILQS